MNINALLMSRADAVGEKAVFKWGITAQRIKAIEELGELSAALSRYMNAQDISGDAVVEEIADVIIMSRQLRSIFGRARVDEAIAMKLDRLERRLGDDDDAI